MNDNQGRVYHYSKLQDPRGRGSCAKFWLYTSKSTSDNTLLLHSRALYSTSGQGSDTPWSGGWVVVVGGQIFFTISRLLILQMPHIIFGKSLPGNSWEDINGRRSSTRRYVTAILSIRHKTLSNSVNHSNTSHLLSDWDDLKIKPKIL